MTKYYTLDVSRRWIVSAPDDMEEDKVFAESLPEFLNIDFGDFTDITLLENVSDDPNLPVDFEIE